MPGEVNILISSAGRRVELMNCFRRSMESLGIRGRLLAVDCSPTAPAFYAADHAWLVPRCTDRDFIPTVLDLCLREGVRLVVPTIDTELAAYASARSEFSAAGVAVAISAPEAVEIAADKGKTRAFLARNGLPRTKQGTAAQVLAEPDKWRFPLILKPRRGSASIGVNVVPTPAALKNLAAESGDAIVEESLIGSEYTVNFFVDGSGKCICAVPHLRMEIRAGEVSKGVTAKIPELMAAARSVGEALPGAFGALNMQCFASAGRISGIFEINARFGGGYPLAHKAGAEFAKWLLEEVLAFPSSASFDNWRDNLAMLRYDAALFVDGSQVSGES